MEAGVCVFVVVVLVVPVKDNYYIMVLSLFLFWD